MQSNTIKWAKWVKRRRERDLCNSINFIQPHKENLIIELIIEVQEHQSSPSFQQFYL